jgi:hypothetical protein
MDHALSDLLNDLEREAGPGTAHASTRLAAVCLAKTRAGEGCGSSCLMPADPARVLDGLEALASRLIRSG